MCKEVDSDTESSNNSVKAKHRDVKIISPSEEPASVPKNNQFAPPKHETTYIHNEFQITDSNVEEISISALGASDNHSSTHNEGKASTRQRSQKKDNSSSADYSSNSASYYYNTDDSNT